MKSEPLLIVKRRFTGRILESGLLILAVALGVGAAASGLSLLLHTNSYSRQMLESPEYRELIVSTQDNAEDMETPLIETVTGESIILTYDDLEAAELVPQISFAYLSGKSRMRFMNGQFMNEMQQMEANRPEGGEPPMGGGTEGEGAPQPQEGDDFRGNMTEMLQEAASDSSIIIPEVEELYGYEVTPQFFSAWKLETQFGSLFTSSDMNGTSDYVVLGVDAAEMINRAGEPLENLIGKKILSMRSYYIIAGILEETGTSYDESYFSLDKQAGSSGAMDRFRPGGNKQLRFTVTDPEDLDSAAELLSAWFASEFGEGQTVISNPREEAEKLINRNRGISYLILFLSLAGLFIASVNISHILMSRTLRMKKHVGILKALGASNRSILKLFATEAAAVTLMGAVLGTIIAFPLSGAMEKAMGLEGGSWLFILAGVLLSSILTFAFSVIPSFQNSGIEAAEAMRQAG
ncbi:ABC transporter permease [Spirochaeta isovalerica]|uniref:ABC-type transport system, involved in lipoprotein release, permease component n=1 Tax=Spirochaeta isovalerica TaxID=150 RepID=A0A841R6P1_9SPIO|nr:FtsX-like permease family protein [Spirochaeta isovalerica]MBB6478857.1 hypothetical protein [Spirochaeta isovalerica]